MGGNKEYSMLEAKIIIKLKCPNNQYFFYVMYYSQRTSNILHSVPLPFNNIPH